MNETDILAVDVKNMSIYDFKKNGETDIELLDRANESKRKDIETWDSHYKNYPDRDDFKIYSQAANEIEYKIMTWDEYEKAQREFFINRPLLETTEEQFDEMLNILPPKCWTTINEVEMFCMSEMEAGAYTYTVQYAKYKDKYYTKIVDITDKSTWINNFIKR